MAAYQNARLEILGFWGEVRKALSIGHTSKSALLKAQKRGDLRNLILLGDQAGTQDDENKNLLPVVLNFRLFFPDGYNDKSNWDVITSGASTYFDQFPNVSGFSGTGLGYERTGSAPILFRSQAPSIGGFPLLQNCGFAVRCLIPKPAAFAVYTLARWDQWQLQLIDGSLHIMRLAPAWTQTDEDALHALQAMDNPTTLQQAQINTYLSSLYKDYTHLSGFGGKNEWYGVARMIMLLPEPRGIVHIWDGARWGMARHSDILKTRQNGVLWYDSRLSVLSSGNTLYWQAGYPVFDNEGLLRMPQFKTPSWMDGTTTINYTATYSAAFNSSTLSGTDIQYAASIGSFWSYFYATFSTTNNRYTPFLYSLNAYVPAGDRVGSTATAWDSDNPDYNSPILDVQPQFEGEMTGRSFTVVVRDVGGGVFEDLGGNYDSGAWRMCNYYEGGNRIIHHGIVRRAEFGDMRNTQYNQVRRDVASAESVVTLEVCSQEALMKVWPITEEPIGDYQRVGGHARQIINLIGTPTSEYSGVDASEGHRCPSAIAGENFRTRPGAGTFAMDYLRDFIEENGNGRFIYHGDGWSLDYRPTALFSIDGHAANFTSDAAANDPRSYPGRFAILRRLRLTFDWDDYGNVFIVVGDEDADGDRLCQIARIATAITAQTVIPRRNFVGFPKQIYRQNNSWATDVDVAIARRSLQLTFGLPPRFGAFETYYHSGLVPGFRITADGTPARVFRAPDGSWAEDKMIVIYREME